MKGLEAKIDLLMISAAAIGKDLTEVKNTIDEFREEINKEIEDLAASTARQFIDLTAEIRLSRGGDTEALGSIRAAY